MFLCQNNPLQNLSNKTNSLHGLRPNHGILQNQQQSELKNSLEQNFLSDSSTQGNKLITVVQPIKLRSQRELNASWLDEFKSMKVDDPLEFSQTYKQMYSNYEVKQYLGNKHLSRPLYAHMNTPSIHMTNQCNIIETKEMDDILRNEFNKIENELIDEEMLTDQVSHMNSDQVEFQKAAKTICSTVSENCKSSEKIRSKFSNSSFIGLMRRISDGDVTLKNESSDSENCEYIDLYSQKSGEIVGHKYLIVDEKIQDPLESVNDLSGLSSTEAAHNILQH